MVNLTIGRTKIKSYIVSTIDFSDIFKNDLVIETAIIDIKVGLYVVSTVDTYLGPETAIIDSNENIYSVEKYKDCELAKIGHNKWVELLENAKLPIKIKEVGYFGNEREIILES